LSNGRVIHGRYRLDEVLASGGFGRVWKAYDQTLRADVAIKEMLLPEATSQAELEDRRRRVEREARNAARLRGCPNIVNVYDVFIEDGLPWVVMQLVEGKSLAEYLASHGALDATTAERVARRVLEALRAAHARDVVHRDIKPANILLADDGGVLLTDFGTAVHRADTKVTQTGMLVASMEYIAPERLGDGAEGAACDLFSLGATLYEATEGTSPFHRDTLHATVAAVLHYDPPRPEQAGDRLGGLIVSLLNKDPDLRPDAEQALALLAKPSTAGGRTKVLKTTTVKQPPPVKQPPATKSSTSATEPPAKSGGGTAGIWLLAALVAFIGFGFFYGQGAVDAKVGDCVWDSSDIPGDDGQWSRQPCSLPVPGATNYKVMARFEYNEVAKCSPWQPRALRTKAKAATLCVWPQPTPSSDDSGQ
jgi:serine/threonine protein kinase